MIKVENGKKRYFDRNGKEITEGCEMVKCIVANFCEHFNDTDIDHRRYQNMTAYRKHKANVTAQKLVKIYKKYANI